MTFSMSTINIITWGGGGGGGGGWNFQDPSPYEQFLLLSTL